MAAVGILGGISSTIGTVTKTGTELLGFASSIGNTINGIQDSSSGTTQCNSYIAQTQGQMDQLS